MLFIDLQEAYDRVDRSILLAKLKQLNFPISFIDFIQHYYFNDNVTSESGGKRTKPQYQARGLRQGCNLSSILFAIYISELGFRVEKSGLGVELNGKKIGLLMFADDLVFITDKEDQVFQFKQLLERWSTDFKMKVSERKTQIISPNIDNLQIVNHEDHDIAVIKKVIEYQYLGIMQRKTTVETAKVKSESMMKRVENYRKLVLRWKRYIPDTISVYIALWEQVAIASMMHGVEGTIMDVETIEKLEKSQIHFGKSILGVRPSTANSSVYLELGFKPFLMRILKSKLEYVKRARTLKDTALVKMCLEWQKQSKTSSWWKNLKELIHAGDFEEDFILNYNDLDLKKKFKKKILDQITRMETLKVLPLPEKWWRKPMYLEDTSWSKELTRFRVMNAGLGNRDADFKEFAVYVQHGRVIMCPLCLKGSNNEVHLLVECEDLESRRESIPIEELTLKQKLEQIRTILNNPTSASITRYFLGQENDLSRLQYMHRGKALMSMISRFMELWSKKAGRTLQRKFDEENHR